MVFGYGGYWWDNIVNFVNIGSVVCILLICV